MAVDIVVGYLAAAIAGVGKRWADRRLDALLDELTTLVADRLGGGPLDRLAKRPRDKQVRHELGQTIDQALSVDHEFARELDKVIAELERSGGRTYIELGPNYSGDPVWIKLFIVIGTLLTIAGAAIFGYTVFTYDPDISSSHFGQMPPGVATAAGVFFAGFVILTIASLGHSLSKRR